MGRDTQTTQSVSGNNLAAFVVSGVPLTSTGATPIGTVPFGKRFIPMVTVVNVDSFAGTQASAATASVGSNSTSYNNIAALAALAALTATSAGQSLALASSNAIAGGSTIEANVTIAAAGSSLVSTATFAVFGILV